MDSYSTALGKPPEKVSVHIAARIIKCSKRSVRRYILENELPAERNGHRAYLVRRCDLQAFMEKRSLRCSR
jgi:excisionase family DNA binding protein